MAEKEKGLAVRVNVEAPEGGLQIVDGAGNGEAILPAYEEAGTRVGGALPRPSKSHWPPE